MVPDGADLIDTQPVLRQWWRTLSERPAVKATAIDMSVFQIHS